MSSSPEDAVDALRVTLSGLRKRLEDIENLVLMFDAQIRPTDRKISWDDEWCQVREQLGLG